MIKLLSVSCMLEVGNAVMNQTAWTELKSAGENPGSAPSC